MIVQVFLDAALQLVIFITKELFNKVEVRCCLPEEDPKDTMVFQYFLGLEPAHIWLFGIGCLAWLIALPRLALLRPRKGFNGRCKGPTLLSLIPRPFWRDDGLESRNVALDLFVIELLDEEPLELFLSLSLILLIILKNVGYELLVEADDGARSCRHGCWICISLILGPLAC